MASIPPSPAAFSAAEQRKLFALLPTGVVAITGRTEDGKPTGFVVGTFQSLSLDPALVTFCVDKSSSTWPVLRASAKFTANILSVGQEGICKALGRKGEDKFQGLTYDDSAIGTPRLPDAAAWLDCRVLSEVVAGDHFVIIATIAAMDVGHGNSLVFCEGKLGSYQAPQLTEAAKAPPQPEMVARIEKAWISAWGDGDTAAFEAIVAPGYVRHSKDGHKVRLPELIGQIEASHAAFGEFNVEVLHAAAQDDMIALHWRTTARHTGSFMDVPATGREVVVHGASFLRHHGGRIVEEWVAWDPREMLSAMKIWHLGA